MPRAFGAQKLRLCLAHGHFWTQAGPDCPVCPRCRGRKPAPWISTILLLKPKNWMLLVAILFAPVVPKAVELPVKLSRCGLGQAAQSQPPELIHAR